MRARAVTASQVEASDLGMWVFLTTETLFFGALFFAYTVGRLKFPEAFAAVGKHTDLVLGTLNTAILLTSSFFMALALEKANRGMRRAGARLLDLTATLGVAFLVIKAIEYWIDFANHLVPGARFRVRRERLARCEALLHAVLRHDWHPRSTSGDRDRPCTVHRAPPATGSGAPQGDRARCVGLYWHFVDVIWVFLFPLLYLVARK